MTDTIPRKIMQQAADYAVNLDYDVTNLTCGKSYALDRGVLLSIGAFRAFEFLEENGYRVMKVEMDGEDGL